MSFQEPYKITSIATTNIIFKKIKNISNKKIIFLKYNDSNKQNNFVIQLSKLQDSIVNQEKNEIEFKVINKESI